MIHSFIYAVVNEIFSEATENNKTYGMLVILMYVP